MVLLSHQQSSGAEIRGIWILPFCVGDRARASNWCTTPLAILCLTKHWHPGLSMTQNFLSFLSWNRNWNGFSRMPQTRSRTQNHIHVLCIGIIHLFSSNFSNIPKFGRLLFEFSKISKSCLRIIEFHYYFICKIFFGCLIFLGKERIVQNIKSARPVKSALSPKILSI